LPKVLKQKRHATLYPLGRRNSHCKQNVLFDGFSQRRPGTWAPNEGEHTPGGGNGPGRHHHEMDMLGQGQRFEKIVKII
jgi:hypothetical protein